MIHEVKVNQYTCERCGHVWLPRNLDTGIPLECAKCNSAYWNRPKREKG